MGFLYETHMHTSQVSACATSTAAEQVRAYKEKGYTGVIITDHFINGYSTCTQYAPWEAKMRHIVSGFEAAKKEGDRCGLDVFLGWEYTIKGTDFLTYGLGLDFLLAHPDVDKLTAEAYSELVHKCGGYIAQAHPYRVAWYIENCFPADWRLLDGVEIFNAMDSSESNEKARKFAKQHNLPVQAGSDSHSVRHPRYSGVALSEKAKDIFDIIEAIKGGKVDLI